MRVLIADDEPRVRFALRVLLEQQTDVQVVGEAVDVEGVMAQAQAQCPDLILLDWDLPHLKPAKLLASLRRACPETTVVALSGRPEARRAVLEAGVDGFACKCDSAQSLLAEINDCRSRRKERDQAFTRACCP